jgi:ferredoxin
MPLWLVRGLRRGVVTTRYPARPDVSARYLPAPPAFRPERLTLTTATRLAAACPSAALRVERGELVYDMGACTACGRCAAAVPDAVTSSGEWELATTRRNALVKRFVLR